MEYYDQKIINERNAQKKQNIYEDDLFINGEIYKFTEHSLYSGIFSIMLPETFIDMPEQFAKVKYPMEQRPSCIKTNLDTSINFAFNFMAQEVTDNQLAGMLEQFRNGLRKMYPTTRFYDARVIELNDSSKLGWFDMKTPAFDEPVYTLMAFTPIKQQLLHIIFNVPARDMIHWKPIVLQVIQSICKSNGNGKEINESR